MWPAPYFGRGVGSFPAMGVRPDGAVCGDLGVWAWLQPGPTTITCMAVRRTSGVGNGQLPGVGPTAATGGGEVFPDACRAGGIVVGHCGGRRSGAAENEDRGAAAVRGERPGH